jgi:endonuclease/exonuclease/phosphatase family metal-dependent hydrolase
MVARLLLRSWTFRVRSSLVWLFAGSASACALVKNYDDPDGPRYSASFAPEPAAAADVVLEELTVCSYNIELSEHITEAIGDLESDGNLRTCRVVLLQEMDWPGARSVAEALALDVVYYPGSIHSGRDFGNAVLSRWPIVDDSKLILPHRNPTNGRIRIAVSATLDAPSGLITAYSMHGDTPWLGPAARLDQAEAVAADAARLDGPVVVGGDFNTSDPRSVEKTVALFASHAFSWASAQVPPEVDGPLGKLTLDHMFVKGFSVTAAGAAPTHASDHQPIWVKLRP